MIREIASEPIYKIGSLARIVSEFDPPLEPGLFHCFPHLIWREKLQETVIGLKIFSETRDKANNWPVEARIQAGNRLFWLDYFNPLDPIPASDLINDFHAFGYLTEDSVPAVEVWLR